jgi:hypothetical protein
MQRSIAESITRNLLSCAGHLDQSVGYFSGVSDEASLTRYRRLVGQLMGLLYIEILRELFDEFPDLEPHPAIAGHSKCAHEPSLSAAMNSVRRAIEELSSLGSRLRAEAASSETSCIAAIGRAGSMALGLLDYLDHT